MKRLWMSLLAYIERYVDMKAEEIETDRYHFV